MRHRFDWWWALGCVLTVAALPLSAQTREEDDPIEVEIVEVEEETPAAADPDPSPATPVIEQPPPSSRWVAGAWCALRSSGSDQPPPDPAAEGPSGGQGEGGQNEDGSTDAARDEDQEREIGCDAGAGMRLIGRCYSQGCLSLIGALGMKTVGFGVAWTVTSVGDRPVSVAIGYALPFNGDGIYSDVGAMVIGATISVGGRQ